jgi:type VI secretion system secreted protein Hcp
MAFDAYLKLDGIKGESQDFRHKGEIDILSFTLGVTQTGISASGGGGGAGKSQHQDMQLVKKVDASSPLLYLNCACGAHIKEAMFVVRKAGGSQLEYLKIKLTDVLISSYKPHGNAQQNEYQAPWSIGWGAPMESLGAPANLAAGANRTFGDEVPLESLSLNFAKLEFSYQPQGPNGAAQGGAIIAGWNVKANTKV